MSDNDMDFSLSQLLVELEGKLRLTNAEQGLYGDKEYRIKVLNRGQRDFVRRTKLMKDNFEFTTQTGVMEYDLISLFPYFLDLNSDSKVYYDNTAIDTTSIRELENDFGDTWRTAAAGTPNRCYLDQERYFGLYVPPDSVKTVKIPALVRPKDMVSNSDYPFNGNRAFYEYQEAPLLYALWKISKDKEDIDKYKGEYNMLIQTGTFEPKIREGYSPSLKPIVYNRNRNRNRR